MIVYYNGNQPPDRAHLTDSGYDLISAVDASIPAGQSKIINTGIYLDIPYPLCGMVVSRSGMAAKHGVTVLNSPGIIDPGYHGEIGVLLYNGGTEPYSVSAGDRVAQMVFVNTVTVDFRHTVDTLSGSDRGNNGFGSTGR